MPNPNQNYKERVVESFEGDFMNNTTTGVCRDELQEPRMVKIRDFISKALDDQMKEVKMIITKEIRIAQLEGQPTSRLTSLYNKLD